MVTQLGAVRLEDTVGVDDKFRHFGFTVRKRNKPGVSGGREEHERFENHLAAYFAEGLLRGRTGGKPCTVDIVVDFTSGTNHLRVAGYFPTAKRCVFRHEEAFVDEIILVEVTAFEHDIRNALFVRTDVEPRGGDIREREGFVDLFTVDKKLCRMVVQIHPDVDVIRAVFDGNAGVGAV